MVVVAMVMVAVISMVALAIDMVALYSARAEAQRLADSGALAGAKAFVETGVTGDPGDNANHWSTACTIASEKAKAAVKNTVQGQTVSTGQVSVCFPNGTGAPCDACAGGGGSGTFHTNPQVKVSVQVNNLPLFFARIFGQNTAQVSATSTAEAFNPSGSRIPVSAKCVKPWLLPNIDPSTGNEFVDPGNGALKNPGFISLFGIIGEKFTLKTGCNDPAKNSCTPQVDPTGGGGTLTYYPADMDPPPSSGPSCWSGTSDYEDNVAGCNSKLVACGDTLDLDTSVYTDGNHNKDAIACMIHASGPGLANGQDVLDTAEPFRVRAGRRNPLRATGVAVDDFVTTSNSIVTVPVYDPNLGGPSTGTVVHVVGFLQLFVDQVDGNGQPHVTVLNVAGCDHLPTGTPVAGGGISPVPVRLIR
jgi:hypothetical protein